MPKVINIWKYFAENTHPTTKQEDAKARELICPNCNAEMVDNPAGSYCPKCRRIYCWKEQPHHGVD